MDTREEMQINEVSISIALLDFSMQLNIALIQLLSNCIDIKFEFDDVSCKQEANISTSVSNGCVDYRGRTADKPTTRGWKASPFIIGF